MSRSYTEKLKDPRWQRKRLKILERDDWECQSCGDKTKQLQVHHGYYETGRDPWDYDDETLVTLCKDCHPRIQKLLTEIHKSLAKVKVTDLEADIGFYLLLTRDNAAVIQKLFYFNTEKTFEILERGNNNES